MKELFLPYNLALIAKEKEFDEKVFAFYRKGNLVYAKSIIKTAPVGGTNAPLYQQIIDWFRDRYHINLYVGTKEGVYICYIHRFKEHNGPMWGMQGNTYYSALNRGIEEAFKLI